MNIYIHGDADTLTISIDDDKAEVHLELDPEPVADLVEIMSDWLERRERPHLRLVDPED